MCVQKSEKHCCLISHFTFFLYAKGSSQIVLNICEKMLSLPQVGWVFIALPCYFLLFYFYEIFPFLQQYTRSFLLLFQFWKQTRVVVERFPELIVKRWLSLFLPTPISKQNKWLYYFTGFTKSFCSDLDLFPLKLFISTTARKCGKQSI